MASAASEDGPMAGVITEIKEELRAFFVECLGEEIGNRFDLPGSMSAFYGNMPKSDEWRWWCGPENAAGYSKSCVTCWDETPQKQAGYLQLFVMVGHWSDKHDIVINCDSTSEHFGKVYDLYDVHPFSNNLVTDSEADTLDEYVSKFRKSNENEQQQ